MEIEENKMKIKSYTVTLGEIFKIKKPEKLICDKFIIPGYQRPYEWSEEQIKTALESIENGLDDLEEPLLFGTIHLNKASENAYEIIDGQQRLTTFYLMLIALGEKVEFSPQNEINKKLADDLARATDSSFEFYNKHYSENYLYIKKHIEDMTKEDISKYKKSLLDFLVNNITFVVIETSDNNSIEKTLQIFNSLNTTGLSLDVKDVFKIRFRDYLQKSNAENDEEIFEKINNAYSCVTENLPEKSPYYVSENDLIETFKLYLVGKEKSEYPAENLKMSNQKFFEKVFKKNNKYSTIETFVGIAKAIEETQKLLEKEDKRLIEKNNTLPFAKELLDRSGYGKLKNILFLFIYCQCKENSPAKQQLDNALEMTEFVWKFCSIYRTVTAKVINGVFNYIGKYIINEVVNENFEWNETSFERIKKILKKAISDDSIDPRTKEFSNVVGNNIFENSRCPLFTALSYINDSENISATEVKKTLFYRDQWDLDIEHIASRSLYDNNNTHNLINSLGNLIYLERKINRSLGTDTKETNCADDLKNKQTKYREYNWKTNNKKGSELKSVDALYKVYSFESWTAENIIDNIEKRRSQKLDFLKSVYSGFGVFSD